VETPVEIKGEPDLSCLAGMKAGRRPQFQSGF